MNHILQMTPIIDISVEPIELCKLLKVANMVGGGGEAKIVISEGYVFLNGEVEFQKRKKIYHNDIIEFNGETIQVNVVLDNSKNDNDKPIQTANIAVKQTKKKPIITNQSTSDTSQKKRTRKPISF